MKPNALWRKVIDAKYKVQDFGWFSKEPRGSYGCSVWKDIFREIEAYKSGIGYKIGRGNIVSFWHDIWCDATLLSLAFLEVYAIASLKFGSIEDHMV